MYPKSWRRMRDEQGLVRGNSMGLVTSKNGVGGVSLMGSERSSGLSKLILWTVAVKREGWRRKRANRRKREEAINGGLWSCFDGLLSVVY